MWKSRPLGLQRRCLRGFQTETLATVNGAKIIYLIIATGYWPHIYICKSYVYIYITYILFIYIYIYILFLEEDPLMNKKSVLWVHISPKSFRLQMVVNGISAP